MLKLHQHITRAVIALVAMTLLLSGLVGYFTLKENNIDRYRERLIAHIELIKLSLPPPEGLDTYAHAIKEKTELRFTLISEDGIVLAESHREHSNMDNHAHRKEIINAQKTAFGEAIRHSDSVNNNFLYVAHRSYYEQKPVFIRLATNLEMVSDTFHELWLRLMLIFGISFLIGLYGIYKLSLLVRKEIDTIIVHLQMIADKEYTIGISSHFSFEFFEIANYLKKLAIKLEKRAKQKRKYTAKIKLISQQRSDVISAISHEFKNPIASIMGYAQTLLEDPHANAQIRERFLGKIIQNGQKISNMIDRLTLATKFENGDFNIQNSTFDVSKIAADCVQTFREKYPNRTINAHLSEHIITADRTMIDIVISNLIDNALKYSDDTVDVILDNNALHVKDLGIGIKEDEIEHVTQKFYRTNSHSWDNSMGLGLALVSYILKLHNTTLEIHSTLGVGSDFSFKLPSNQ